MRDERRTFCRLCNAGCGAIVTVEDERIIAVRGDREHPISQGYLCPKGRAMGAHHHHPRRLDRPAVRRDGRLVPGSWDGVLDDLAERIRQSIAQAGPASLGMYKGTAHYLESATAGLAQAILDGVGSDSWYTSLTVDCPAVTMVAEMVAGHPWLLPVPDIDARLVVLVGTNPMASHGHTFNIPQPKAFLRQWARQGKLWVIDPRRTESSDVAATHLPVRPGTDYLLLAHLVRELLRDGADRDYLARHTTGANALAAAVEPFTLERAEKGTGVPGDQIIALLADIRAAGRVAMATGTGVNFQRSANLSVWMAWMVSAVTGSLDRPGGMWFNPGYLSKTDTREWEPLDGTPKPGPRSRPELSGRFGELPCVAAVDEIEAAYLRSLVVLGGNPLIAWPQPDRLTAAFGRLDTLAVIDVVANEMTDIATHVLPATSTLERADVTTGSEVYGVVSFSQYTDAVVPPSGDRRPTWWILRQLAQRLGVDVPAAPHDPTSEEEVLYAVYGSDPERWQAIRTAPTAVVTPHRPYGWIHDHMPDQRLRLAPDALLEQLAATPDPEPGALQLIPRRLLRKTNSLLSDGHGLSRPAVAETILHPHDAGRRQIADGSPIVVRSAHGTLQTIARLDDRAVPGTVSTPHGFAAVNAARLISSDDVDPLTGMPQMTGLAVDVAPA